MKNKKQKKQKKKLKIKKAKRDLSEIKKLLLQKIPVKKTTLDTKVEKKTEIKEEKKQTRLEIITSQSPDFGVSRPVGNITRPVYEPVEISQRQHQRDLERTAFEGGAKRDEEKSGVYGASSDLYSKKQNTLGNYTPKGELEKDLTKKDQAKKQLDFDPEKFIEYKTDVKTPEAAYRKPEDIEDSIKRLEGMHMEDFINKKEDISYNPNRIMGLLEKDKADFDKKYKRGKLNDEFS